MYVPPESKIESPLTSATASSALPQILFTDAFACDCRSADVAKLRAKIVLACNPTRGSYVGEQAEVETGGGSWGSGAGGGGA